MSALQKATVLRVDTGAPFILDAQLVQNSDGSVSFLLADGTYAGQEPGVYGQRHDGPATQQYQRAAINGTTVVFTPHPNFPANVYLLGLGTVFPA